MKNLKKYVASLMALVLVLSLLAGCGNGGKTAATDNGNTSDGKASDPEVFTEKSPEEYSGEFEVWTWNEGEMKTIAAEFNKVYPNVKIKIVPVDNGDVNFKLQSTAASGGNFPDIAYVALNTRGQLLDMDIWDDLSQPPYNFDENLVFPSMLSQMKTADGRVICIEREYNPSGMVFRRSLAKEYLGTDDPTEVYNMVSDWDKLVETGKMVSEKSQGKVYMLPGLDEINWILNTQYSEEIFTENKAYLTKYFTHMLTPMVKVVEAGISGHMQRWTPAWNASFRDGNVLLYQYAPWSGTAALKANAPEAVGDWTVIESAGGACILGGTGYGIPREAKNKELAWLFIRWSLLTEEGSEASLASLEYIGPLKSYFENMPEKSDPYFNGQDVNRFLIENVAPKIKLRPASKYDTVLDEVMKVVMERLESDPSFGFENALAYAIEETSNKLPAEMEVE